MQDKELLKQVEAEIKQLSSETDKGATRLKELNALADRLREKIEEEQKICLCTVKNLGVFTYNVNDMVDKLFPISYENTPAEMIAKRIEARKVLLASIAYGLNRALEDADVFAKDKLVAHVVFRQSTKSDAITGAHIGTSMDSIRIEWTKDDERKVLEESAKENALLEQALNEWTAAAKKAVRLGGKFGNVGSTVISADNFSIKLAAEKFNSFVNKVNAVIPDANIPTIPEDPSVFDVAELIIKLSRRICEVIDAYKKKKGSK